MLPLELLPDVQWSTDQTTGYQTPADWTRQSLANGLPQIWPIKSQNGQSVPAVVERQPECVFKLKNQLSPNEWPGGTDALLWPGRTQTYKIFHGPSSTRLIRTITGLMPGRRVKLTAALLPDVGDIPRGPSGQLEPDHCRCSIALIGASISSDSRIWEEMKFKRDYAGVNRPWNLFQLTAPVSETGVVEVIVEVQQNWADDPTGVAWFFGPFTMEYIDESIPEPPSPEPVPTTEKFNLEITVVAGTKTPILEAIRANLSESPDVLAVKEIDSSSISLLQIIITYPTSTADNDTFVTNVLAEADRLNIPHRIYKPES
jgi:hypothetical protein